MRNRPCEAPFTDTELDTHVETVATVVPCLLISHDLLLTRMSYMINEANTEIQTST